MSEGEAAEPPLTLLEIIARVRAHRGIYLALRGVAGSSRLDRYD